MFVDPSRTIAVLLPEGNRGVIVACRFKLYLFRATRGQVFLGGADQQRADTGAAIGIENVDGDDVAGDCAPWPAFGFRDYESCDFVFHLSDHAISAWIAQERAEFAPRIGDSRRIAGLVYFEESFEVIGAVGTQACRHVRFVAWLGNFGKIPLLTLSADSLSTKRGASYFQDDGEDEGALGSLLVQEALQVYADLFLDHAPIGLFF